MNEDSSKQAGAERSLAGPGRGGVQDPSATEGVDEAAVASTEPAGKEDLRGEVKALPSESAEDLDREQTQRREAADAAVLAESRSRTRRSFLLAGAATAAGVGFYGWLNVEPSNDMQPGLLRRAFEANAAVSRTIAREHVLAPTYPLTRAETLRVNGVFGLKKELVPESWRLQLVGVRDAIGHPNFAKDVTSWEYRYTSAKGDEDQGHDTKVDPKLKTGEKMAPASVSSQAQEDENHTGRKPRGMEEAGESESTLPPNTAGLLLTMDDILRFPQTRTGHAVQMH